MGGWSPPYRTLRLPANRCVISALHRQRTGVAVEIVKHSSVEMPLKRWRGGWSDLLMARRDLSLWPLVSWTAVDVSRDGGGHRAHQFLMFFLPMPCLGIFCIDLSLCLSVSLSLCLSVSLSLSPSSCVSNLL